MATFSDPLTLLREFATAKKAIVLEGDHIVFSTVRFNRKDVTAYRSKGGSGDFYAIDAVWALLEKGHEGPAAYAKFVGEQGIQAIGVADRRELLAYLKGEISEAKAIDLHGYKGVQPVEAALPGAAAADAADATKADARPTETTAEQKAQLGKAQAAFMKLLSQPTAVASEEVGEPEADGGEEAVPSKKDKEQLKETVVEAKPFIRYDRERLVPILKREKHMRTRKSLLLASANDKFPVLTTILEGFAKRNKRELSQSQKFAAQPDAKRAKEPTVRASHSSSQPMPPAPAAAARASSSTAAAGGAPSQLIRHTSGVTDTGTGGGTVVVLLVPSAITSIVNMLNARQLLDDAEFIGAAELKAGGAIKESSITVKHTFDDGSTVQLLVLDKPDKLTPAEWKNVVGCIAQGSTWQFKGWPFKGGETEIFAKMCGFYVRFSDEVPNQRSKGWAVTNLVFSRERSRKHEVGVMMTTFWAKLHQFMKMHKPHLLHHSSVAR